MSARSKRTLSPSSSQHTKKSKLNHQNVLNAFTSNANGGRSRLTHSSSTGPQGKVIKPKGKTAQTSRNGENEPVPSATSTEYMSTLVDSHPHVEFKMHEATPKPSSGKSKGTVRAIHSLTDNNPVIEDRKLKLNNEEMKFLEDIDTHSDYERDPDGEDGEVGEGDKHDGDEDAFEDTEPGHTGDGSELIVEDITPSHSKQTQHSRGRGSCKILVSDFKDPKLAIFAKRCVRLATCTVQMCPDDPLFSWPTFTEEMEMLGNEGRADRFLQSLAEINKNIDVRDQFLRFMGYGISAICLDIGREARIRTSQFFQIPGSLTRNQIISSVTWLLKDRVFHHGAVDLERRTTNSLPFRSPLLGVMLRGYLVDGRPKQDRLLITKLQREERIPIPFIAMLTVLIQHALQEFSSGYKIENALSNTNLRSHYRAIMSTLTTLQEKAPAYVNLLQTDLYKEMITLGPEIVPPQTYDYESLNSLALQPMQPIVDSQDGQKEDLAVDGNPTGDQNDLSDDAGGIAQSQS
ncbi:hypothetical protein GYMLUDRAFT_244179 [Collybiopsis luxurians FD-317 M1]|uniref:DUF6532 domain-containing protein n=1 Tax=Collybiopsis luxurians FD-317 M1 TaxID=944289 RepID=A0A0D0CP48_9AGAR|nr:hypothetical protein GYMLUDRAFT_244179 [Collybiopsis luxurians FD-317 M1]